MPPKICRDKSIDDILNDFQEKFYDIRKKHDETTYYVRCLLADKKLLIKKLFCSEDKTLMQKHHCDLINEFALLSKKYSDFCMERQAELETLLNEYEPKDRAHIIHIANPYKFLRPTRTGSITNVLLEILY